MDREKTGVYYDVFWGKITAYDGSTYYSWTEQQLLPGPTSQDMAGGRAGTLTAGPAYEPNCNFLLNGSLVLMTRVYYDPTLDWVYAAVAGAQQSTSCAGSGSGSGSGSGASSAWYCLNAPAGGGGGHDSPCNLWPYGDCSGGGFEAGIIWGVGCSHDTPNKLYATFTDAPAALAALGIVPLCYDADTGGWDANMPAGTLCGVGVGGPYSLIHLYSLPGITSDVLSPSFGIAGYNLSVVQCSPLILQGTFDTPCGSTAIVTITEQFPTSPYCGG